MSLYIFLLYHIYHLCFTCIDFYDLSAWGGCWFDVYIRRFIYKFLNVCPFDYTVVAGSGKVGPVNQVNHTSWVAVVTPTDRPKSVRNRCLIELFCGVVCVVTAPFDISVGVGAFVIGLSQISSFLSLICILKAKSEAKEITRNVSPTLGDTADFILRGPYTEMLIRVFIDS